jgi:dihydroneopterin aldolase
VLHLNRILADRMTVPEEGRSDDPVYRMFVRDLVLDCSVGVHDFEKLAPQRVRINVDLAVHESPEPLGDDIANVLSYEDVIAGIKALRDNSHVNLVETMAQNIAELCLADRRVDRVTVRVEKLDIEPDAASVGIEIERRQPLRRLADVYRLPPGLHR